MAKQREDNPDEDSEQSLNLTQITSNEEVREYLEYILVKPAREKLFDQFKRYFWVQRMIEAVVIGVVAFLGLSTYSDFSSKVSGLNETLEKKVEIQLSEEFKEQHQAILESKAELKMLQRGTSDREDIVREIQNTIKKFNSLITSDDWKNTKKLQDLMELMKKANEDPDKAISNIVAQVKVLNSRLHKVETSQPWSIFSPNIISVSNNQSSNVPTQIAKLKITTHGRPIAFILLPGSTIETGSYIHSDYAGGSGARFSVSKTEGGVTTTISSVQWHAPYGAANKTWPGSLFLGVDINPKGTAEYELNLKSLAGTTTVNMVKFMAFELPALQD